MKDALRLSNGDECSLPDLLTLFNDRILMNRGEASSPGGKPARLESENAGNPHSDSVRLNSMEWLMSLLDFEVRVASRYRSYISMVLMRSQVAATELCKYMAPYVRESDEFFDCQGDVGVLMCETSHEGVVSAVRRFQTQCLQGAPLSAAVVTYPADAQRPSDLMEVLNRRFLIARALGQEAIVDHELLPPSP